MLEDFLIQENKDWILLEYKKTRNITEHARQQLVNSMVDFLYTFFDVKVIEKNHKIMTVSAVMQLFPDLVTSGRENNFMVCFQSNFQIKLISFQFFFILI